MARLAVMLVILVLGALILAPIVMMTEPDPLPGDFVIAWSSNYSATYSSEWNLSLNVPESVLTILEGN